MDLKDYAVRTDLALDAQEIATSNKTESQIPGVLMDKSEEDGITITQITIENEQGSQALGKQQGHYITIEVPGLRSKDTDLQDRVATKFAQVFSDYLNQLNINKDAKVLIIGLGNWNVTPDALGPLVVEDMMVTRHYFELMPDQVSDAYRQVSAIAPGVLGITGIETGDIVQGIVEKIQPDLVIAVDALASKALERVNTTIQISNVGIHPGSGIGSKRKGLTLDTLGVPVVAIGVPTVVFASTIVTNSMEMIINNFRNQTSNTEAIFGMLDKLTGEERLGMVKEILQPLGHDLLVTPKDVDEFIGDIANVIANGLNAALHDAINQDNVSAYTH